MTDPDDIIEGEIAESSSKTEIVKQNDNAGAMRIFNPLDAEPVAFKKQLESRQENYDNLKMHLFGVLVPGKDFLKIHVTKNCDNKYTCTKPLHFSDWMLSASGADKIRTILGLSVHYPDLKDYKRAALKGYPIEDVILDAQILGHSDQVISHGVGACSRSEFNTRSLNSTIKRAAKRARVDAVTRLPAVSALFEDDFLEQVARRAKKTGGSTTASRTQQVKNKWDTGARLEVCPIGRDIKGKAWRDIPTDALKWLIANVNDKPDITRAAAEELTKRSSATGSSSIRTPSSPASDDQPPEYTDDDIPT